MERSSRRSRFSIFWAALVASKALGGVSELSLRVPSALTGAATDKEKSLNTLGWVWLLGVIVFFSLSQSKRAPYILPVAPAVAFLAAGVVDRWLTGRLKPKRSRLAASIALLSLSSLLLAAGIAAFVPPLTVPAPLVSVAMVLGGLLIATGVTVAVGVFAARIWPTLAPVAVMVGVCSVFLVAAVWALPAVNPWKSARGFASELNR